MSQEKSRVPFILRSVASGVNLAGSVYLVCKDQYKSDLSVLATLTGLSAATYVGTNFYEWCNAKPTHAEQVLASRERENSLV